MQIPHPATFAPLPSASAAPGPAPQPQPPANDFNFNPYQSPTASTPYLGAAMPPAGQPLASLGARFGGAMLDGVFTFLAMIPGGIFFALAAANQPGGPPQPGNEVEVITQMAGPMAIMYGGALVMAIVNWVLIAQSGQSLGKKIVGTRIVRLDGSLPGFGYGVAMRAWVPGVIGLIPWIGGLFSLVNILFIFGQDRRCIHDQIAGTRVVVA